VDVTTPCTLSIQVDPGGNWIEVENTGRKEESIGGWKIGRKVGVAYYIGQLER